jgi:hypothetical protein
VLIADNPDDANQKFLPRVIQFAVTGRMNPQRVPIQQLKAAANRLDITWHGGFRLQSARKEQTICHGRDLSRMRASSQSRQQVNNQRPKRGELLACDRARMVRTHRRLAGTCRRSGENERTRTWLDWRCIHLLKMRKSLVRDSNS